MRNEGISPDLIPAVFKLLEVSTIDEAHALLGDRSAALAEIDTFRDVLAAYGIADLVVFNIGVIRGLSYYTGIVFEAFDTDSSLRAIFGGGRYGKLLASIGGADMAGVGLGFGDVVIAELLADKGLATTDGEIPQDLVIGFMQPEQHITAVKIATALRQQGKTVHLALSPEKPKTFFARAGGSGARQGIYLGPDDLESGTIRIKNLADRSQTEMPLRELLEPGSAA